MNHLFVASFPSIKWRGSPGEQVLQRIAKSASSLLQEVPADCKMLHASSFN
jgi:hypothetical protein